MSSAREMQKAVETVDFFKFLPGHVVVNHIYPQLAIGDLNRSSLVSKHWSQLFGNNCKWEILIARDFNIPLPTLYEFRRRVLAVYPTMTGFFISIYQHLRILKHSMQKSHSDLLTREMRYLPNCSLFDPTNHMALLASCANIQRGPKILRDMIPSDEQQAWMWVSLYANAESSVEFFLSDTSGCLGIAVERGMVIDAVIALGYLDMLKMLLNKRKYHLEPTFNILYTSAAMSGNVELYHYICRKFSQIPKPELKQLQEYAALSGSLEMLLAVSESKSMSWFKLSRGTINNALRSGNFELINHLFFDKNISLTRHRQRCEKVSYIPAHRFHHDVYTYMMQLEFFFRLKPRQQTLYDAAECGNLEMVQSLFLQYDYLYIDNEILVSALSSGSLELVRFLLNPNNLFELEMDDELLYEAIAGGNLEVVKLLLNPPYNLRLDLNALYTAAEFGHLNILYFLLDPQHGFNLSFSARDDDELKEVIPTISSHVVDCSVAINEFFHQLSLANPIVLTHLLEEAATKSVRHFARMMIHAITHPDRYPLGLIGTEPLFTALMSALNRHHTLIEREQLKQMLLNSSVGRLRDLAQDFEIRASIEPLQKRARRFQ